MTSADDPQLAPTAQHAGTRPRALFVTLSPVGDLSYGGVMRGNFLRNALVKVADVDTLVIHGGPAVTLDADWNAQRVRTAITGPSFGLSREGLRVRKLVKPWLRDIVDQGRYDLLVVQFVGLALLLPKRLQRQMVFDADDFLKHAPATSESLPARLKRLLRNKLAFPIAQRARFVWFANPNEQHLRSADDSALLPNVIALPDPQRPRARPVAGRILMVGLWKHAPNLQGLTWFHETVWPRLKAHFPDVELHVVGSYDPAQTGHLTDVIFHGFVDDLATAYDQAQLVIAPILSGGGTQIKVIDALGHGRPLVASRFAHAGFAQDLTAGEHLLTAEGADDWLETCGYALENSAKMEEIALAGEARVRERYGVERLSAVVAETVKRLRGG